MSDVFVSHSSKDKDIADGIVEFLESRGISCWIAPRNIVPGSDWAASISTAITASKVFLLVYTHNSAESNQCPREVSLAESAQGVTVIPYKTDDAPLNGSYQYYLTGAHWITADIKKKDYKYEELYSFISSILGKTGQTIHANTYINDLHIHNDGAPVSAEAVSAALNASGNNSAAPVQKSEVVPKSEGSPADWIKSHIPVVCAGGIAAAAVIALIVVLISTSGNKPAVETAAAVETTATTTSAASTTGAEKSEDNGSDSDSGDDTSGTEKEDKDLTAADTVKNSYAELMFFGKNYTGKYSGTVNSDGEPVGEGEFSGKNDDGDTVEASGTFGANGKLDGKGKAIVTFADGTREESEGDFVNGALEGNGKRVKYLADGKIDAYEGEWKAGSYSGNGKLLSSTIPMNGENVELKEFDGHVYALFKHEVAWNTAKVFCEALGGHLATVTSAEEENFVRGFGDKINLGGRRVKDDPNSWEWVTGEEFAYTDWREGEPNNASEHVVALYTGPNQWIDSSSYVQNKFLCEWDSKEDMELFAGITVDMILGNDLEIYDGNFKAGVFDKGTKTLLYNNNEYGYVLLVYEGSFLNYKLEGKGKGFFVYASGREDYIDSEFSKDYMNGEGVDERYYRGKDDDSGTLYVFSGTFVNSGLTKGTRTDYYPNTDDVEQFDGTWSGGNPVKGKYTKTDKDGNILFEYEGDFEEGRPLPPTIDITKVKANAETKFNGHTYKRFDVNANYDQAKKYCEDLGGHLVSITSEEEQKEIEKLVVGGRKYYWLGGYMVEEGVFAWETGEEFSYSNWYKDQPDHYNDNEDRIELYNLNGVNQWNDVYHTGGFVSSGDSSLKMGFICEFDS